MDVLLVIDIWSSQDSDLWYVIQKQFKLDFAPFPSLQLNFPSDHKYHDRTPDNCSASILAELERCKNSLYKDTLSGIVQIEEVTYYITNNYFSISSNSVQATNTNAISVTAQYIYNYGFDMSWDYQYVESDTY